MQPASCDNMRADSSPLQSQFAKFGAGFSLIEFYAAFFQGNMLVSADDQMIQDIDI